MKKIFITILFISSISLAQYYGERTTEQSFEQSELFFNQNFLNPFGVLNFKQVAPGLIDDPFLNLSINPSNVPDMNSKDLLIYLDFRGDRTEAPISRNFYMPYYFDAYYRMPYVDPRWFTKTRTEPEPVVSAGMIFNPISELTKDFFIGGTYQLLNKEEKFYTVPNWIYYPMYLYDAFGIKAVEDASYSSFPVQDRYAGKDEMITDGHLFSLFSGYKITNSLSIGLSANGVLHSRDGEYKNNYDDEYGSTNFYEHSRSERQMRQQDYDHFDISGGLSYKITPLFNLGVRAGILKGEADQDYSSGSSYSYQRNAPETSTDWYKSFSNSSTDQVWNHDGTTKYIGFNLSKALKEENILKFYYKYSTASIELSNSTFINDTSFNAGQWYNSYDNYFSSQTGFSRVSDIRSGTGERLKKIHEGMLNFQWKINNTNTIYTGFYYKNESSENFSKEPVNAVRESRYDYTTSNGLYEHHSYNKLIEDKILEWNYSADYITFQIPVIVNFEFSGAWGIMLGVNKIFSKWEIQDKTVAYFFLREKNENNVIKQETNFGERYTQPAKKFTDNSTKMVASFYASISQQFKVRLLLDPEFEHQFRIAQWWLGFEAKI